MKDLFAKVSRKGARRAAYLAVAFVALTSLYQNCGQSFQVSQLASESIEPLSVPTLQFASPSAAPELTNAKDLDVAFTMKMDRRVTLASARCSVDGGADVDCTSGKFSLKGLFDGDHTIRIVATDSRGQNAEPLTAVIRVDATPPTVRISQQPATVSGSTSASFGLVGTDNLSGVVAVECAIGAAEFAACTTPSSQDYINLASGAQKFRVRAKDKAGNISPVVEYSWTVDLTAPIVMIVKPADFIGSKSISITFSGTDEGVALTNFECQLDGGGYTACTSPKTYQNTLTEGLRKFDLRARDTAGNLSAPVSVSFTVDTTAPAVPTISTTEVSPTRNATPKISFTSTDMGSGVALFRCAVDAGTFADCTSPFTFAKLADGNRTLRVVARDALGNESAAATLALTVDTVAPTVQIDVAQSPAAQTSATLASVAFTRSDAGSGVKTVECRFDQGSFAANCTSPSTMTVGLGAHTFEVRVTDNAGNVASATHSWTVVTPTTPPLPDWTVPTITLTEMSGGTFNLATTLPTTGVKPNGTFSVDPSGAQLPSGMSLSSNGVLSVGNAVVGDTNGVIFVYTEPAI